MEKKRCTRCGDEKPITEFGKCQPKNPRGAFKDGRTYQCRDCHNKTRREWGARNRAASTAACRRYHEKHPEFRLWVQAKARAKTRGTPFTITRADIHIPATCPACQQTLAFSKEKCAPTSPSLDCIRPALGYAPGNIAVICFQCNTIKSNASLERLKNLVHWLETVV